MTLLERLKEQQAKATPGPWEVSKDLPWVVISPEPAKLGKGHVYVSCGGGNNEDNATYLASALNALPDLIAVAEAAKMVLKVAADWDKVHPEDADYDTVLGDHIVSVSELDAALAKLTEEGGRADE